MIRIIYNGKQQIVKPTIFPDGTSQVWKLELGEYLADSVKIVWNFEQEAELIWLRQLVTLFQVENIKISEIYIPYLPYARQDKDVSNSMTFAKHTFLTMLPKGIYISTLDQHSNEGLIVPITSYSAIQYILKAIKIAEPDVLVFPDKGAYNRYNNELRAHGCHEEYKFIVLDKKRDSSTGEILGTVVNYELSDFKSLHENRYKMLIIDDICDGGATFVAASLFLHTYYNADIALYVTHGIFSKGYDRMIDSGILQFFTTQSLTRNINGFELEEI